MVHKIASPDVPAVDACGDADAQLGNVYKWEREIILPPFTRFHVCKDTIAVLPVGCVRNETAKTFAMRLLYTHIYVEDTCPLCAKQD
jgi:hypothetical protein